MPAHVSVSGKGIGSTAGVRTDAITIPADTGMTLGVAVMYAANTGRAVSSVTVGGVALTQRTAVSAAGFCDMEVFVIDNPTPGTVNIVSTLNQSTTNMSHFFVLVSGGGGYAAAASAAAATVDVASATAGIVIGFSARRNGTAIVEGAGQTVLQSDLTGAIMKGIATSEDGGATVTTSFTWTGGDSALTAAIAIAPGATATLEITQQPPDTWDGDLPRRAVIVRKTTDGTTTDTSFTGTITLTKASGTGTIGGTVAVSAVAGISTLGAWTMTGSGAHTLQASDGTLTVVSSSFKVATGTGVPGSGAIIIGGGMQRAMKDAETTAARKTISLDVRDSAGAAWAGSVSTVKPKIGMVGSGTFTDGTNDVIRPTNGGAALNVLLTDAEAASWAAGDIIEAFLPAASGRLESTHGFYEITADDVAAASNTPGEIADAVWDEVLSGHSTTGTGGKVLADAATAAALTTVSGKVDTVDDFLDTEMPALTTAVVTLTGYVDTEVAALSTAVGLVKVKTDNLPASPAAVGSAMVLSSGGLLEVVNAVVRAANGADGYVVEKDVANNRIRLTIPGIGIVDIPATFEENSPAVLTLGA